MSPNRSVDDDLDDRPSSGRPDLNSKCGKRPQPSTDGRNDVSKRRDPCGSLVSEVGCRGKSERKPQNSSSTSSSDLESSEDEKPKRRRKNGKPKLKQNGLLAAALKFLCSKEGLSAGLKEICDHLSVKPWKIKEIVFDFDFLKGNGRNVRLAMDLTICKDFVHKSQGCSQVNCSNLHICPKLISDECNLAPGDCELGHSFTTRHNLRVLDKFGIRSVSPDVLVLLLSRLCDDFKKPKELPNFCEDYNSGRGCSAGEKTCSKFHICEKFIMSDGEEICDGSCKLNHMVLKSNVKHLLDSFGFDTNSSEKELRVDLKALMKEKLGRKEETPLSGPTKNKVGVPRMQGSTSAQAANGLGRGHADAVEQRIGADSHNIPRTKSHDSTTYCDRGGNDGGTPVDASTNIGPLHQTIGAAISSAPVPSSLGAAAGSGGAACASPANPTSISDDSSSSGSDSDDANATSGGPRAFAVGRSGLFLRRPGWSAKDDNNRGTTRTTFSSRVAVGSGDAAPAGIHPDLAIFARPSTMKKTEEDDHCPVCQEKFKDPSPYISSFGSKQSVVRFPCDHLLHHNCADQVIQAACSKKSFKCLSCNTVHGVQEGNQPVDGKMVIQFEEAAKKRGYPFPTMSYSYHSPGFTLPGFSDSKGTFRIEYHFKSGTQGPDHPNPGRYYAAFGFPRIAYLPATKKGYEVLCMLKIAFDRRLIFTMGPSATLPGGGDSLIWNGIHHKTQKSGGAEHHGYPDPNYLNDVTMELAAFGVTPADITPGVERSLGIKF